MAMESYSNTHYVLHPLAMAHRRPALPLIPRTSYGPNLLDHLAADGAGFAAGEVAVVAVLQVDADLPWCPFYLLNFPCGGGSFGSRTARSHLTDGFVPNFADELVEDPNALLILGIFPGHLLISLRQDFFTNLNAIDEGNKGITV